jgi:hypothetical protein
MTLSIRLVNLARGSQRELSSYRLADAHLARPAGPAWAAAGDRRAGLIRCFASLDPLPLGEIHMLVLGAAAGRCRFACCRCGCRFQGFLATSSVGATDDRVAIRA